MKTNTTEARTSNVHRTQLELWFAQLGLTVTEVERCPEPSCELCDESAPMSVAEEALAA
ncbi:MAG: hypothetical protein HKN93_04820 [Acidimicrobiia bacterium]|nr:hypothetical protein [Acidimicrobiia bacterium]